MTIKDKGLFNRQCFEVDKHFILWNSWLSIAESAVHKLSQAI